MIRVETDLGSFSIAPKLFRPDDMDNVKRIQAGSASVLLGIVHPKMVTLRMGICNVGSQTRSTLAATDASAPATRHQSPTANHGLAV
jgi:hypothetical protein